MSLKILHVGSGMPGWSGTEKHIIDVSSALERRGHQVTVACRPGSEIERRALAIGLPVVHLEIHKQQDWKQFPKFVRALRGRYDVVHIHHYFDYRVPAAAARALRFPVVVMTRHIPTRFRSAFVAYACGNVLYDKIIAVSDFIRGLMIADHVAPDRIVVVKNGIDLEPWQRGAEARLREELGIPASALVVAAAGRLYPGKGFDVLVRAVAEARREGVNAFCLIAGIGELQTELERLCKELDVQSAVRMLGFRQDVAEVFAAADAVAVPSSTLPEAFSYAALEGLASGRPVIASRMGALPELITEDVGYLTSPGDTEGIARAIADLAHDPDKRAIMGRKALQRAQNFTLDTCAEGLETVYETLRRKLPLTASENVFSGIRSAQSGGRLDQ